MCGLLWLSLNYDLGFTGLMAVQPALGVGDTIFLKTRRYKKWTEKWEARKSSRREMGEKWETRWNLRREMGENGKRDEKHNY